MNRSSPHHSAATPKASRRQRKRGDTIGHPNSSGRLSRSGYGRVRDSRSLTSLRHEDHTTRQTYSICPQETRPARHFRLFPRLQRGSSHHSSHPCQSKAAHLVLESYFFQSHVGNARTMWRDRLKRLVESRPQAHLLSTAVPRGNSLRLPE